MKRHLLIAAAVAIAAIAAVSCRQKAQSEPVVVFETSMGNIEMKLFNDTPLHRDNFLGKVDSGFFNGKTFNRVIQDFMIQCGEEQTERTVEPEIVYPKYFHKRGMLGMGRSRSDLLSNSEQIYIVWGKTFDDEGLDKTQARLDRETGGTVKLTDEIRETYKHTPGTPHLDGQFTLFGEVISDLAVIDSIQRTPTDSTDRPITDVTIYKAYRKQ